ncbi:Transposase Tc1-like [Trinorchestia longiramus]|nr:Transposase Tc1-like [Trinorchestia longiramus]
MESLWWDANCKSDYQGQHVQPPAANLDDSFFRGSQTAKSNFGVVSNFLMLLSPRLQSQERNFSAGKLRHLSRSSCAERGPWRFPIQLQSQKKDLKRLSMFLRSYKVVVRCPISELAVGACVIVNLQTVDYIELSRLEGLPDHPDAKICKDFHRVLESDGYSLVATVSRYVEKKRLAHVHIQVAFMASTHSFLDLISQPEFEDIKISDEDKVDSIQESLCETPAAPLVYPPCPGMPCLATYEKEYYRARIISCDARAETVQVQTVVKRRQTTCEELKDDLKASGIEASKHTISRALRREGLRSRPPRRTSLLQKCHVKVKLKYANDHLNKPAAFWNSVLWSDETKIELFGRNSTNHVWRQQNVCRSNFSNSRESWIKHGMQCNSAYLQRIRLKIEDFRCNKTKSINQSAPYPLKFGVGSIMVRGCFSSSGVDKIHIIEGTMNGGKYREILEEQLLPSACLLKLKREWKFQQDNDPKHTAYETKEWLRMKKMNILEWPSQSPDMNPIENLWRELKLKIQKRCPNNITELKEIDIEEWNKITPETYKRLVVNYYKRLEAIINNNMQRSINVCISRNVL